MNTVTQVALRAGPVPLNGTALHAAIAAGSRLSLKRTVPVGALPRTVVRNASTCGWSRSRPSTMLVAGHAAVVKLASALSLRPESLSPTTRK